MLVGAAPVQQHQRSRRLAGGRALETSSVTRGVRQRRQSRLDLLAQVLEVGWERKPLAEVLGILVGREAGPERGELEQDAVRLAEVDRLEVEAVDHGRRPVSGLGDPLLPVVVIVDLRRPRDVVHGSGAGNARPSGGVS